MRAGVFDSGGQVCRGRMGVRVERRFKLQKETLWCAARMANPNFLILGWPPNDSIAANVIEQESCEAERRRADFAVPDKEAARHCARFAVAAIRDLDSPFFVREKDEHIAVAGIKSRIALVDRDRLAEFARDAPIARHAVAKASH